MRTFKGVFNSDEINRIGLRFTLPALVSALTQKWSTGTPNCIGHDRNRVVGWSRPLGIHLQPQLSRLTGITFVAENVDEVRELTRQANAYYADWILEHVEPHVPELLRRLGSTVVAEPMRCDAGCAALVSPGLATRIAPQVFALRDKDGLFPLSKLQAIAPGVFSVGEGLLLFAHPFFRRTLSRLNTLNTAFLEEFAGIDPRLNPRIALDEDMVGLTSTFHHSIELQYWRGPRFDDDLSRIPSGITVHEADDNSRFYQGISRTEFRWYGEGARRSFEAEELVDRPSLAVSSDKYGCRFVHSMLHSETHEPIHLDGAIRLYDEERMLLRLDRNLFDAGRHTEYTKLWRVDGALPVRDWKSLVAQYFRDNSLIGEYFGAPPPEFQPEVIRPVDNLLQAVIPYNMEPNDGVQLHVSYHRTPESKTCSRAIVATDVLTDGDLSELYFIDSTATEIIKRLRREGESIDIPGGIARVAFGDTVLNLPLICHGGEQAARAAQRTLGIVARFIADMASSDSNRLVSFSICHRAD